MASLPWSGLNTRQMTTTVAEFRRSLETAFPGQVESGPNWIKVSEGGAVLRFVHRAGDDLRLGGLSLPTLQVTIQPLAGDEETVATLLRAVDRATQRGGG